MGGPAIARSRLARRLARGWTAGAREAGFALLLVLWSLVLLALILSQVVSTGRTEAQLAYNLRAAATAEAVADGAVQNAIFSMLQRPRHGAPHQAYELRLPGGMAEVRIDDLAGSVNPNTAGEPLLEAMLQLCGASAKLANTVTQSIMTWRAPLMGPDTTAAAYRAAGLSYAPPHAAFETSGEAGLVLGMTPGLRACLLPHISVYTEQEEPLLAAADPFVLKALQIAMRETGAAMPVAAGEGGDYTTRVTAAAATAGGGRFVRRAIVRLLPGDAGRPFRILDWGSGS